MTEPSPEQPTEQDIPIIEQPPPIDPGPQEPPPTNPEPPTPTPPGTGKDYPPDPPDMDE